MTKNTFQLAYFLLLCATTIMTSNAHRRNLNSISTKNNMGNNMWGTNVRSPGWSIDDKDIISRSNQYHIIGASRSGFYLFDDDDANKEAVGKKLVSCTRYGQKVKKPKREHGHGVAGH